MDDDDASGTRDTGAFTEYTASHPLILLERPDSHRRPTRSAAQKAGALIQAQASPCRVTSGSQTSGGKNDQPDDQMLVEVEDVGSDQSRRSAGMRLIKKRAGRHPASTDPIPDSAINKVRRGRTAAQDPSSVK